MPEMTFTSRWPDGRELSSYSPSLVVHDHLSTGDSYPVADFVRRATEALQTASDRVQARFGYPCSRAVASLAEIEALAGRHPDGTVRVERMQPERAAA